MTYKSASSNLLALASLPADRPQPDVEDLLDRIDKAIAIFVESGSTQTRVLLPEDDYKCYLKYAGSTPLTRHFLRFGLAYCTLPVLRHTGKEIVIAGI